MARGTAIALFLTGCVTAYELPEPRPDWESEVVRTWRDFAVRGKSSRGLEIGHNTVVIGCDAYVGGVEGFVADLNSAVHKGLSCLADLGPARQRDAARLATLFDGRVAQPRPVKVYCAHNGVETGDSGRTGFRIVAGPDHLGLSFPPESPDFPGFHINLSSDYMGFGYYDRQSLLFHEMLHWLGYLHSSSFDLPYLATACCFPDPRYGKDPGHKSRTCDVLRHPPPFPSETYFREFAGAARRSGDFRLHVVEAAVMQTARQRDGALLMAAVSELYNERHGPVVGAALAKAALAVARPADVARLQTQMRQAGLDAAPLPEFTTALGGLLGAALRGERLDYERRLPDVMKMAGKVCDDVSRDDRADLYRLFSMCAPAAAP